MRPLPVIDWYGGRLETLKKSWWFEEMDGRYPVAWSTTGYGKEPPRSSSEEGDRGRPLELPQRRFVVRCANPRMWEPQYRLVPSDCTRYWLGICTKFPVPHWLVHNWSWQTGPSRALLAHRNHCFSGVKSLLSWLAGNVQCSCACNWLFAPDSQLDFAQLYPDRLLTKDADVISVVGGCASYCSPATS